MVYDELLQHPRWICLLGHQDIQGRVGLAFILVGNHLSLQIGAVHVLLKHISCTEERNKNMCTSSTYQIDHKGSMLPLNDYVLLTKHLVCNPISTQTATRAAVRFLFILERPL